MKKLFIPLLVLVLTACGQEMKENSTDKTVKDPESEKVQEKALLSTQDLKLGFCPSGNSKEDRNHFNLSAQLFSGATSDDDAYLVISVVNLEGRIQESQDMTAANKGVEVWLNAAQTNMNYAKVTGAVFTGNKTSMSIDMTFPEPDIKISGRNDWFHGEPHCTIVGNDDARDLKSGGSSVECIPSILADLKGSKRYRINFVATGQKSGNLIFSYETTGNLAGPAVRCSYTTLNVLCWGSKFSVKADRCSPACQ